MKTGFQNTRLLSVALLALLVAVPALEGQDAPRALDHDDYDRWSSIQQQGLSADGLWLTYRLNPREGDAVVHLEEIDGTRSFEFERGVSPSFTRDSRFALLRIQPTEEAREEARENRGSEQPRDSLAIVDLASGEVTHRTRIRNVTVPGESEGWVLIHLHDPPEDDEPDAQDEPAEETEEEESDEEDQPDRDRPTGTELVWLNLDTGEERRFSSVTSVQANDDGSRIVFIASSEDAAGDGVWYAHADDPEPEALLEGIQNVHRLTISDDWDRAAFLSNRDTWTTDDADLHLFVADLGSGQEARSAVLPDAEGLPADWVISNSGNVSFSDSGERVFFGTAPRPEREEEDEDEEADEDDLLNNVEVDIWSWHDGYLQPQQLQQVNQERSRTHLAVLHLDSDQVVQLGGPSLLQVSATNGGDGRWALGQDDIPYRPRVSWDTRYVDVYLVDMETGEQERILDEIRGSVSVSPTGRFIVWWDGTARSWMTLDTESRRIVEATRPIPHPIFNELDDRPSPPGSYGSDGWTEDDERMVVRDAYDLWLVDPTGEAAPENLTAGYGRDNEIRLRLVRLDWDDATIRPGEEVLFSAFHTKTKADGYYRGTLDGSEPQRIVMEDLSFGGLQKADDADRLLFTMSTFERFPNLWISDLEFGDRRQMTDANPHQAEYRWGSAEIVDWTTADGEVLQGILYKPDDFDPTREYPMMVYFYERSSNGLHNYYTPGTGTSISRSFYVSRGYLLFVPDIPYKEGYPGESAMNAVIPGVLSLVDEGFVDRDRIGVQGHSWGGYQIAYMITRSNIFAAAEAGAPVTNMTSAYGGIRWGSGRVRQMQYEQGQSRIGASLWDAQHRYIENSPLFTAYKVETPLLMLHNDEDGAVPWEEGIQFFVGLRRLNKPVWLLNYNGEAHGLRQSHNQRDWTIRMQQFFDHYLMDAPPPVWLVEGVPAIDKGRTLGLELVDDAVVDNDNEPDERP